jgi:glycosyltransferase involved in cell wall biosynthesis
MRVLHVIPAVAARYGGPSSAVVGMCRALRDVGVETLVATTDADGPSRLDVPYGRPVDRDGVPMIFFRRALSEAFKWSGGLSRWLSRHVADFDAVHVHAVFSHSSIAAGRAARRHAVPYIVRPLGTLDPWSLERRPVEKRALLRLGVRSLIDGAAAMHYTSADEMRLAERAVSPRAAGVVIPIGIDDAYFQRMAPSTGNDTPYVLSLSRLDPKKGLDVLIEAFHSCAATLPDGRARLIIAGDGDPAMVERLRALASAGPGKSRVDFVGWVSGARKLELVRGASVFALTSHQENFGISVAEAMAAGAPALVTPGVNLGADIERAAAGWVVPQNARAVSAALVQALSDRAEREKRGAHARELAEAFRWTRVAEALGALYEGVARPRAADTAARVMVH